MQSLSSYTHETVPTESVEAQGIRYAYRRFGKQGQAPLLFLAYLNSNMDGWDPIVTNGLAEDNEIICSTMLELEPRADSVQLPSPRWPSIAPRLAAHLDSRASTLSLSLGGMIAQQLAHDDPQLVRRLILLGTGPRGGEGMEFNDLAPEESVADPIAFLLAALFTPSQASQTAGRAHVARLGPAPGSGCSCS